MIRKLYTILGISAPIGAMIPFAGEAYVQAYDWAEKLVTEQYLWVAVIIAALSCLASAVTLELYGICAGHLAVSLTKRKHRYGKWAWALMIAYLIIGTLAMLKILPIYVSVFGMAFASYLVLAIYVTTEDQLKKGQAESRLKAAEATVEQLTEQMTAMTNTMHSQDHVDDLLAQIANRDARIEQLLDKVIEQPIEHSAAQLSSENVQKSNGVGSAEQRVYAVWIDNKDMPIVQIARKASVARGTADKYVKQFRAKETSE